jgi:hypothetical protein
VELVIFQRCDRCTMTTVDRDSLERGPEHLTTMSTFHERAHGQLQFGVQIVPVAPFVGDGKIRVGVEVERTTRKGVRSGSGPMDKLLKEANCRSVACYPEARVSLGPLISSHFI